MNRGHSNPTSKEKAVPETADGELDRRAPSPPFRQVEPHRIAGLQPAPLSDRHHNGECRADLREYHLEPEEEGHLKARANWSWDTYAICTLRAVRQRRRCQDFLGNDLLNRDGSLPAAAA